MKLTILSLVAIITVSGALELFGFDKDSRLLHVIHGTSKISIWASSSTTVAAVKAQVATFADSQQKMHKLFMGMKVVIDGTDIPLENERTCDDYELSHNTRLVVVR